MKLLIVRHGESEKNISGLVQGADSKSDLTANGRNQAQRLANRLKSEQIDMAFVSPLPRAQQTAEIILQYHPATTVTLAPKLRERSYGKYEGGPTSVPRQDWLASGLPFGEFKPEGGESWFEAGERATHFIQEIFNQYKGSDLTILIVAHGSIFTYFLMQADGQSTREENKERYDHYHPKNTAMSILEPDHSGQLKLVSLNDVSHLNA